MGEMVVLKETTPGDLRLGVGHQRLVVADIVEGVELVLSQRTHFKLENKFH